MDNEVGDIVTSAIVLYTITVIFVAARLWARLLIIRTIGLDDLLIMFSWICSIAMITCMVLASQHGLGRHKAEVEYRDYTIWLKLQTAISTLYSAGICMAKASFAVLYLRLLPKIRYRILNYCLCVFLACQAVEEVLIVPLACTPIARSWDPLNIEGNCLDLRALWWCTFVFNLFTDLSLFIQPIPSMWKLQMPLAKRLGLIIMLSLGLLVTSISVVRIDYVTKIGTDDTYELAEPMIWSAVELCALIICSCIPSLRQCAKQIPGLNSALGLSVGGSSTACYGDHSRPKGASINLRSRSCTKYVPTASQRSKTNARSISRTYGTTSHVEALRHIGERNESQDEIFPHKAAQDGDFIMVTREVYRQESTSAGTDTRQAKYDASSGHLFDTIESDSVHSFQKPEHAYHP